MRAPFVIVGADAAGLSAASKFTRERPGRDVIVFEKGQWVSFAYCGMPYFIEGRVERLEQLLSLSPAEIDDRGIDLRRGHEVVDVIPEDNVVLVERTDGRRFEQSYSDLLIATGGRAVTGPFDVDTLEGVFTLHDMDAAAAIDALLTDADAYDFDRIGVDHVDRERVEQNASLSVPETAAIVGGSYVGVEMAEALRGRGIGVHLFQRSAHLLPPFGRSVGERVETELRENGVQVHTGTPVDSLIGDERIRGVNVGDDHIPVDLAIIGVGIRPNTEFVADTAIETGPQDAIVTDEFGETTVPEIYAAGDCATDRHTVTGEEAWVPLGLTANRAGRAVGATVAGEPTEIGDIAGTAVVKAFDQECGRVGILDFEEAERAGFEPIQETITAGSRSGYYPGVEETDVTLVADRETGRLLGGSIVGKDRAAVRINTLATALENEMTVDALERLDLAYAPPFSPVWDPILVAGKVLNGRLADNA